MRYILCLSGIRAFFLILMLFTWPSEKAIAQPGSANGLWKKEVTRNVNWKWETKNRGRNAVTSTRDSLLPDIMANAVMKFKIPCFALEDIDLQNALTAENIQDLIGNKYDSITVIDPVSGDELIQVRVHEFEFRNITRYKVLETWTYNPNSGKTEIEIKAIMPIQEMYGDDGVFRGNRPLFWVKYADAKKIISRYEQYHPGNSFSLNLWDGYFSDEKPMPTN